MSRGKWPPLYFGPYRTPKFKYGATVMDEARGEVRIVGLTSGRIPWPIGRRGRHKAIVLYEGLARAVKQESGRAIKYWWGVSYTPVIRWRKALKVEYNNAGTIRLRQEYAQTPAIRRGLRKAQARVGSLERRAKYSAARVGKPMPLKLLKNLRKPRKPLSPEHRRKISEANQGRYLRREKRRPWAKWEDNLLLLPASEITARTGRTEYEVHWRRKQLYPTSR